MTAGGGHWLASLMRSVQLLRRGSHPIGIRSSTMSSSLPSWGSLDGPRHPALNESGGAVGALNESERTRGSHSLLRATQESDAAGRAALRRRLLMTFCDGNGNARAMR